MKVTLRIRGDKVLRQYNALGRPVEAVQESTLQISLANGSRIISLPGDEETIRDAGLWLRFQERRVGAGLVLAIGGPRESEAPGIYASTMSFLAALLDGAR